jgi:hypothetical protein
MWLVWSVKRFQEKSSTDSATNKIRLILKLYTFFVAWKVLILVLGDNVRYGARGKYLASKHPMVVNQMVINITPFYTPTLKNLY